MARVFSTRRCFCGQMPHRSAVCAVLKIMLDPAAPLSTRLRAADIVLAHTAKASETEDIEARVSELERAAKLAESSPR